MSTQPTLPEILSVLAGTYKSIDVRTIGTDFRGATYNVVTSITFSPLPRSICKKEIQERLRTYGLLASGPLKFGCDCLSMEALAELTDQLLGGELKIGGFTAKLGAPVTLASFTGTISEHSGNCGSYPGWQAIRSTFPPDAINTELGRFIQYVNGPEIQKQLSQSGFHGFRELAANYLGSNNDPSGPSCIHVLAPVPVRVARIEIDPAGKKIRVQIQRHRRLSKALKLRGEVLDGLWQTNQQSLTFGPIVAGERDRAFSDAPFELSSLDGHVQLRVVHDSLGIVCTPRLPVRNNVPAAYVNPIFEVFKRFCSLDEFKSLCTEPRTLARDSAKDKDMPQRLFEQYMQWLLSCFGFAALQLGAKESLYQTDEVRGAKMLRGSLDILAYNEQRRLLLIGSCKLNPPPDKDFNNLINIKAALTETLRREANVNVALAIFTAADHCLPHAGYRGENFVAVFDKKKISSLIDALNEGKQEPLYKSLVDCTEQFEIQAQVPNE